MNATDGKGLHRGGDNGGESNYDGCNVDRRPSFRGVGQRMSITGSHAVATAAVIVNDDVDDNRRRGGGALCPPPLRSVPSTPLACWLCNQ
jgi:hypothetical protein